MKKIDIKSALIGVFFTTTVIFSLGATGKQDKALKSPQWDEGQIWEVTYDYTFSKDTKQGGWEPFAWDGDGRVTDGKCAWRKRIK